MLRNDSGLAFCRSTGAENGKGDASVKIGAPGEIFEGEARVA